MPFLETLGAAVQNAEAGPLWLCGGFTALLVGALFYGAQRSLNHARMMLNTPTALIRSAAQGYTELRGMAEMMAGDPIRVPASLRHCVWFKYKIEQYQESGHGRERRRDWVVVEHGTSDSLFNLTDTSGTCAVDPEGAEVHASQRDVWYGQSRVPGSFHAASDNLVSRWFSGLGKTYRYTEHLIRPGDALYVIGQFTTHGGAHTAPLTHDHEVADRLRALKRNQAQLLREFDSNRDGHIDAAEWQAARTALEHQVREERAENPLPPAVDVIGRSADRRRPFVIAAGGEDRVVRRHRRLALLLVALGAPLGVLLLWCVMLRLA